MANLELRKPFQLQQLIDIVSRDIQKNGFTNNNYSLYTEDEDAVAGPDLICYLESGPTFTDDDEEVFPDFVRSKSLTLFYDGRQFEDVLMNVSHQKKTATIDDYVSGLNYYTQHDTFKDF